MNLLVVENSYNMATSKAPKQWSLQKDETLNSFNNWRENLLYTLSLDKNFALFLRPNAVWGAITGTDITRGLVDDGDEVTDVTARLTAAQKLAHLNLMLGQIANYATVIARNTITRQATSLDFVWSKIREHYHFHLTGSRFLDLASIQLQMGERHEDFYQRLLSFFDDNLLSTGSTLTHHSNRITANEEVTPTVENTVVFLWLERIHQGLPALVKQRYGSELRNKTLASIKPEVSAALSSLLTELGSSEESRIGRSIQQRRWGSSSNSNTRGAANKYCCLCRAAKRSGADSHYLSECRFLPEFERREMNSRVCMVECEEIDDEEVPEEDTEDNALFID